MTSPRISRRTLLRGTSAALGLPMLNCMLPKTRLLGATPAAAKPPVRLAWVFFPNGTNPDSWEPKKTGADWELTPSLASLKEHKQDVSILSGLAQVNARSLGDGPGDHARSAAAFLTGAHPVKTSGADMRAGKSADQFAAEHYGRATRLASIELGTEAGRAAGSCDSGYACAYSNNISWRTSTQPMAKEVNPKLAFERLFGNGAVGTQTGKKELLFQRSILDIVAEDAADLQRSLGYQDRQKLDEYFTSVRDVEQRIDRMTEPLPFDVSAQRPDEKPEDIQEHIRLMYDLMVLAFKTDTTRISTFMLGNEGSGKSYPMIGVKEGHHQLSHHQNDPDKVSKIAAIDKFFADQFAYFLQKMKDTPEGDGNLLDNSLILYGGAIRDGNRHDHHDLPILLAGRGGGRVTPGLHRRFDSETPLNNLYLSMLDMVGVDIKEFGDSTGRLDLNSSVA
ncbi:DUF1552 domain-containing protein [Aureliella helgolandensis]|uniref:DUF1552 domain-containing protein n=1 Tax=Aureliella helgolandensis TaxID=2527968 RepID=A0A518GHR5_9BACT|nr:DUF1552 domain-containing protein [Aureliella helgolandensis]QDV28070.1 hypothetical protein Q31a_64630 [Aureliella helgolandensis]